MATGSALGCFFLTEPDSGSVLVGDAEVTSLSAELGRDGIRVEVGHRHVEAVVGKPVGDRGADP